MTEIGEVPEEWEVTTLGHLAQFQPGYPFKSAEFSPDGDRLLRGSNVSVGALDWSPSRTVFFPAKRRDEFQEFILQSGDIVVAMD
jgi:type I restriction enzyme S subunit